MKPLKEYIFNQELVDILDKLYKGKIWHTLYRVHSVTLDSSASGMTRINLNHKVNYKEGQLPATYYTISELLNGPVHSQIIEDIETQLDKHYHPTVIEKVLLSQPRLDLIDE